MAAVAAVAVLSMTAVAIAQTQAPQPTSKISVSPKKAGTKSNPKPVALGIFVENPAESKTTASKIQIDLPKTLRVSGRGLKKCSLSVLAQSGTDDCPPKSIVGDGVAHAIFGPHAASPTLLTLDVTAVVGGPKNVYFYVTVGSIRGVLNAKVTNEGRRLTMSIPASLKKPDGVTYSALTDLDVDITRASRAVRSIGCSGGKHTVKVKLTYEANPVPPPVTSATATGSAKCSK